MDRLLMGIDVGTSACKAAVFDTSGAVIAQSVKEYMVYYPQLGWAEQNPEEWWQSVVEAIKECLNSPNVDAARICGVGVDGQSWSCIPINKDGAVLHNTPIWMDTRAGDICVETLDRLGTERIFEVSGNPFTPAYTTPKILWFKRNKPEVYENTYKFLQCNSYIVYMLTGNITQDSSQGYGLHVFDIDKGEYDIKLCNELEIDIEKLPEIFKSHEVVGEINNESAFLTGLKKGTPVVAGGLDAACGALGAGVINEGQTQEQGGQAGGMSICLSGPISHRKLILGHHVVPGKWLLQGGTVGGGGTLNWFNKELGHFEREKAKQSGRSPFEVMSDQAKEVHAGSDGLIYLPYMAGERSPIWDKNAKSVFFGLSYDKTRGHLIRSMMEGVAFSLKHNIETAKEAGAKVAMLNAMGGSANSRVWTQIKSDVTGIPIQVPASDTATTLGAAILAGVGTGVFKDFETAVQSTVKIQRRHEPNLGNHKKYGSYYKIYLELYEKLKDTMERISGI